MTLPPNKYVVSDTIHAMPVELIRVPTDNTRTPLDEAISSLAASMNALGQQSAISIYSDPAPLPGTELFTVLLGSTRFLAAKRLGWATINAIIVPVPETSKDALLQRLAENRAQTDLSVLDHVNGIARAFELDPTITNKALHLITGYSEWEVSTAKKIVADPIAYDALLTGKTTGWKDTRAVATAPADQKAVAVEKRVAGETCESLRKSTRKKKASDDSATKTDATDGSKPDRVSHQLDADTKISTTGKDLTTEKYVAVLTAALAAAKEADNDGIALRTAQRVWSDRAKAQPRPKKTKAPKGGKPQTKEGKPPQENKTA